MKTATHFWKYLAQFFLEWEMFQIKVVEKIKTHILCSVTYFPKKRAVYKIMCKYMIEPYRTHNKMAHALCMLDNKGYKHTLRIRNTYCFYTATVVRQKRLNVPFICTSLSCLNLRVLWRLQYAQLHNTMQVSYRRILTDTCTSPKISSAKFFYKILPTSYKTISY